MAVRRANFENHQQRIARISKKYGSDQETFQISKVPNLNGSRPVNLGIVRQDQSRARTNYAAQARRDTVGGVLGAASTFASVAATTAAGASLAPVAVGLGLGYGAYKLGEAIGLY